MILSADCNRLGRSDCWVIGGGILCFNFNSSCRIGLVGLITCNREYISKYSALWTKKKDHEVNWSSEGQKKNWRYHFSNISLNKMTFNSLRFSILFNLSPFREGKGLLRGAWKIRVPIEKKISWFTNLVLSKAMYLLKLRKSKSQKKFQIDSRGCLRRSLTTS